MKKRLAQTSAAVTAFAVLASPLAASAATQSDTTTINATVGETITISTTPTVSISMAPTSGAATSVGTITATVNTNKSNGYNLQISNNDATTALVSGGDNINAHTGTHAVPTPLADNTWGFALAGGNYDTAYTPGNNGSEGTKKFAGVPASGSGVTIKTTSAPAAPDTTTVYIGAKVTSAQPTGTYSDTITLTAVTN